MKSVKELISEKYYGPDDRLPSGDSPVGKATQKSRRRARTIGSQSSQNQDRWAKQYDLTQTKVKHGADNPSVNFKVGHREKDEIEIDRDGDDMYLRHKPSSINFAVNKSDETPYDDVRTISWGHDKNKTQLSPKERVGLARTAKQVWNTHVSHRLPKGSIVHNTPSRSLDNTGRAKPVNRRSEIYKRAGFGELDNDGDQFAQVNREISPKQRSKGKSRLKPLNPRRTKVEVEWGKNRDNEDYDEWEDQMTFSDFMIIAEAAKRIKRVTMHHGTPAADKIQQSGFNTSDVHASTNREIAQSFGSRHGRKSQVISFSVPKKDIGVPGKLMKTDGQRGVDKWGREHYSTVMNPEYAKKHITKNKKGVIDSPKIPSEYRQQYFKDNPNSRFKKRTRTAPKKR